MNEYRKVTKVCDVCGEEIESGHLCKKHQELLDKAKELENQDEEDK